MNEKLKLDATALRARVRSRLPPEAFSADRMMLVSIAAHVGILVTCYLVIANANSLVIRALCAAVAGHSQLCIGFRAHDLSHGSVIRSKRLRSVVESLIWGLNLTPAAVWNVHHNRTHHQNVNTGLDSFRYFSTTERTRWRALYSLFFTPNRVLRYSPFVYLTYLVQLLMHTIAALIGTKKQPNGTWGPRGGLLTNVGEYSIRDRIRLALELIYITGIQVGVFHLCGGTFGHYLWAGPVAFLVSSAGASSYIYTQHSLFPLSIRADQLQTTSLRMPAFIDWLHANHSHHTAHHLFPSMRSQYYPMVTDILLKDYPEYIHVLTFAECWRRVHESELFKDAPQPTR